MSIRLSTAEVWAELAASHTGILTTLRADGTPIALPVWFVVLDRRIYVSGPAPSKKFARVARNPRCSFLVESGERWAELRAVHLTGTATAVTDPELLERVGAALDEKYRSFRTNVDAMPDATRQHYDVENTTIEIFPDDRILSWDNARLGVGFDG
jgi:PPOX class probable F420-dependent enzyme